MSLELIFSRKKNRPAQFAPTENFAPRRS
jgi:hypothetical protein